MNAGTNRPGRKDQQLWKRGAGERRPRPGLPLLLIALALALAAVPAQATTGGASTAAADLAQSGSGVGFSPIRSAGATWYGPGLYGNRTACGQTLRPRTIGVAHRALPCGTPVRFSYRGRQLVARVIDRGPFTPGYAWDLTNGARLALGFSGSDRIRYAIGLSYIRR
jgi:rare lipoprotein A (peptidoglycan hydrolase)